MMVCSEISEVNANDMCCFAMYSIVRISYYPVFSALSTFAISLLIRVSLVMQRLDALSMHPGVRQQQFASNWKMVFWETIRLREPRILYTRQLILSVLPPSQHIMLRFRSSPIHASPQRNSILSSFSSVFLLTSYKLPYSSLSSNSLEFFLRHRLSRAFIRQRIS